MKSLRTKPYKTNPETLGEHLRKRRMELGLFQRDAAERLGVNEWTYLGWELNRRQPAVRFLPHIISFLGYDPEPPGETPGERITARRRQLGLTIKQAATLLGMDEGTLKRHESGAPTIADAERRARITRFIEEM